MDICMTSMIYNIALSFIAVLQHELDLDIHQFYHSDMCTNSMQSQMQSSDNVAQNGTFSSVCGWVPSQTNQSACSRIQPSENGAVAAVVACCGISCRSSCLEVPINETTAAVSFRAATTMTSLQEMLQVLFVN